MEKIKIIIIGEKKHTHILTGESQNLGAWDALDTLEETVCTTKKSNKENCY